MTSVLMVVAAVANLACGEGAAPSRFSVEKSLDLAEVPSDVPVGFCLLTAERTQYVAYYDGQRRMTVASRPLNSDTWTYQALPSRIGWDSHNYVTMAVDGDGHLHVSGNMHGVPLIYFRTEKPGDITTLRRFAMTGEQEDRVTYPRFLTSHEGQLLFNYRNGGSGNGVRIWNKYDVTRRTWSRLLDKPLLDGEGKRNAYPLEPIRGPDGWFHLVWVWRDTPDCATNHHLCYARSKDLDHWESIFGQEIELPITLDRRPSWVDPIPSGGGIINGCEKLFLDAENRPVITYHKSDTEGNMQVYAARPEGAEWALHVLTNWQKPVKFSGRGSMGFIGIRISGLRRAEQGVLTMTYRHRDYGSGRLAIEEGTLRPLKQEVAVPREYPQELDRVQSSFKGMGIRRAGDIGDSGSEDVRYVLQWETLGRNRDRPREPPLPQPSTLRLHKLRADDERSANKALKATR